MKNLPFVHTHEIEFAKPNIRIVFHLYKIKVLSLTTNISCFVCLNVYQFFVHGLIIIRTQYNT